METQQLEKQFEMWKRLLDLVLGATVTLLIISFGTVTYGTDWPGFGNYAGGIWAVLQFLATFPGFYLLWGGRWKTIPPSSRINTSFGYFAAGWLNLFSIGLLMETPPATDYYFMIIGITVLLILGYFLARRRIFSSRDEMFP